MKFNIATFRVVDRATGEVLLQTPLYRYFYLATIEDASPSDKTLEAETDEGSVIQLNGCFVIDGLNDFHVDGMKPVALVPKNTKWTEVTVVSQDLPVASPT